MKKVPVLGFLVAFGLAFQCQAGSHSEDRYVGYYKELLSNKAVIQKVHSERNKHLGLTLEEFERAVEKYFLYRLESRYSPLANDVSIAAKLAMEHYQTNSPETKTYTKNFVKLQNAQYLEMANQLEIEVVSVKHFMEAVAYAGYLHKQSKKLIKI